MSLLEDMHVHSTWSDGVSSIEENVREAESMGLRRMCCVDHVRRDTAWLADFVADVRRVGSKTKIELFAGAETKILNAAGDLDLPPNHDRVDFLYVADHQFPLGDRCVHPKEIRAMIKAGELTEAAAIESLCRATIAAVRRYPNVVIAHLFSVLPKAGLDESQVPAELLEELAVTARDFGARIEIDERWKCPSFETVSYFLAQNVPVWFSTDSHRKDSIGRYEYNRGIFERLA